MGISLLQLTPLLCFRERGWTGDPGPEPQRQGGTQDPAGGVVAGGGGWGGAMLQVWGGLGARSAAESSWYIPLLPRNPMTPGVS